MQLLKDFFFADKLAGWEKIKEHVDYLSKLVNQKYHSDRPLLEGKKGKYIDKIENKKIPTNGKECNSILQEFSDMFDKAVIWESASCMQNITPPVNVFALAGAMYASMYNPNFSQDEACGWLMQTELLAIKYLSELAQYDFEKASGIFTFGGKGTNMYAAKLGMQRCIKNCNKEGIAGSKIITISNEKSHPCHGEVTDWVGIGSDNCVKIKCKENGQVDLKKLEAEMRHAIENDTRIACIYLNGGTTNEIIIDPIQEAVLLRDRLVKEYTLDYIPYIHVDSVIGWAWLFFTRYDFERNELEMDPESAVKIRSLSNKISEVRFADSFGADFHKTGFCPYISSVFMCRDGLELTTLSSGKGYDIRKLSFGEYSPFEYSLELTRSCIGPVSAYLSMESLGISGYQTILYNIFSATEYIRKRLGETISFEVINKDTEGIATLCIAKPVGCNQSYYDILSDKNAVEKLLNYNYQLYLYLKKQFEEGTFNVKITFSKSYRPYGLSYNTGALKLYPMSPLMDKHQIDKIINELMKFKAKFDYEQEGIIIQNDIKEPIDFVYR